MDFQNQRAFKPSPAPVLPDTIVSSMPPSIQLPPDAGPRASVGSSGVTPAKVLGGAANDGAGGAAARVTPATINSTGGGSGMEPDIQTATEAKMKLLTAMAEKMGCTVNQLAIAWCLRSSTSQCVVMSCANTDQLLEILNALSVISVKVQSFETGSC